MLNGADRQPDAALGARASRHWLARPAARRRHRYRGVRQPAEALLWLASATPEAGATGVDELLRCVLGLERNHWKKLIGALDEERTRDMARGVAQVTAVQGVPARRSTTEDLLMADDFYRGQRTAHGARRRRFRGEQALPYLWKA